MEPFDVHSGIAITAGLAAFTLTPSSGSRFEFTILDHARRALARGLHDIEISLGHAHAIAAFEARSRERFPWLG